MTRPALFWVALGAAAVGGCESGTGATQTAGEITADTGFGSADLGDQTPDNGPAPWDLGSGSWDLGPGSRDLGLGTPDSSARCYEGAPASDGPAFVDISHLTDPVPIATEAAARVAGGVALVDVNGDAHLDLVVADWGNGLTLLLGDGSGRFVDATAVSGLGDAEACAAVAYADVDNDGDPDLYAGAVGAAYLFLNDGTGRFEDRSEAWGVTDLSDSSLRSSAVFGDFDEDGWLDLYATSARFGYDRFDGVPNRLYRNRGTHFEAVAEPPGGSGSEGASLAAAWSDFDGDGDLDLWVVNDYGMLTRPNQLYLNQGPESDWEFVEVASERGFDQAIFGMSATLGDFDNDGDLDGYSTNVTDNVLLVMDEGRATDMGRHHGVTVGHMTDPCPAVEEPPDWSYLDTNAPEPQRAAVSRFCQSYCRPELKQWAVTGWAALFLDADQNGWLDLFVANGEVGFGRLIPEGSAQPNTLLLGSESGFIPASTSQFPALRGSSRGAAAGDIDRDGDLDLVWIENGFAGPGRLRVLENRAATGHWLQVSLRGTESNREGIGARVSLTAGGSTQLREIDGGQGYASASERIAHFGLGEVEAIEELRIEWPSGRVQVLGGGEVAVDRRWEITEGE